MQVILMMITLLLITALIHMLWRTIGSLFYYCKSSYHWNYTCCWHSIHSLEACTMYIVRTL